MICQNWLFEGLPSMGVSRSTMKQAGGNPLQTIAIWFVRGDDIEIVIFQ